MSKRNEISYHTKQNLADAFWTLYCNTRIEKISVKEITNKAGYNRGTFYEYFKDVYDVLEFIENSLIPTLDELPPISIGSTQRGMRMDAFFTLYEKNSQYYSVLLGEKGDPAFASKLKNTIKPLIMQELSSGLELDQKELDYVLEYTLSAMIGVMSYWFTQEDRPSFDKMHELIYKLMEKGVIHQL
jgi:AcrR family transcriptional regulator